MKIKYSALVSDMRGKLNGSVASRNRGGSYLRNKTTPVNPQTTFQQQLRSVFGALSSMWRSIGRANQESFIRIAEQHPYNDIFGDRRTLSGHQMFIKLNQNLHMAGTTAIEEAVSPQPFPEFTDDIALAVSATTQSFLVGGLEPAGASIGYLVYATPPVGKGIRFVKNKYRFLGFTLGTVEEEDDFTQDYIERFGAIASNSRYFVKIVAIDATSGFTSAPYDVSAETAG